MSSRKKLKVESQRGDDISKLISIVDEIIKRRSPEEILGLYKEITDVHVNPTNLASATKSDTVKLLALLGYLISKQILQDRDKKQAEETIKGNKP